MSRSVYRAPFHRQIIPWLYVLVFLLAAPVLIFYTAGYRYNPKKGAIERNGTLIVDSSPSGAQVFIDDVDTREQTPITFQNITPGWHRVRVTKAGYNEWQKTLEVRPERVTFANQLWLWKMAEPRLVLSSNVRKIDADPIGGSIALITSDTSTAQLGFWNPGQEAPTDIRLIPGLATTTPVTIRWRQDGRALVLNGLNENDPAWMAALGANNRTVDALSPAFFHWDGLALVGIHDRLRINSVPESHRSTEQLERGTLVDEAGNISIVNDTSTNSLLLMDKSFLTRVYSLPNGQWRLADLISSFVLLKDGTTWIAVHPGSSQTFGGQISGDYPRWLANVSKPAALFLHGSEAWSWELGSKPDLLWRQSEPLVQTQWHQSATAIFVADAQHLFALGLDERDGRRVTSLANFDRIEDFTILGKTLYIAGTKNGQSGVWSLEVE